MNAIEKKAINKLLRKTASSNFHVLKISDGEEVYTPNTNKKIFELLDNLDEAWMFFCKEKYTHTVYIVFDNNDKENVADMFADWSFNESDGDGFNRLMDSLLDELEVK